MTVQSISPNELFTVRIYKNLVARPDTKWANTYELVCRQAKEDGLAALAAARAALVAYERAFHTELVEFDRAVISTAVPDGSPYNPATFISIGYVGTLGTRAPGVGFQLLPLEMCLLARRTVDYGRAGRALYRGVLAEGDIESPAGKGVLVSGAETQLGTLMDLGEISNDLATAGLELVLVDAARPDIAPRTVRGIVPAGVTVKQVNNRYFDRP